jgi:hypothetical protein
LISHKSTPSFGNAREPSSGAASIEESDEDEPPLGYEGYSRLGSALQLEEKTKGKKMIRREVKRMELGLDESEDNDSDDDDDGVVVGNSTLGDEEEVEKTGVDALKSNLESIVLGESFLLLLGRRETGESFVWPSPNAVTSFVSTLAGVRPDRKADRLIDCVNSQIHSYFSLHPISPPHLLLIPQPSQTPSPHRPMSVPNPPTHQQPSAHFPPPPQQPIHPPL